MSDVLAQVMTKFPTVHFAAKPLADSHEELSLLPHKRKHSEHAGESESDNFLDEKPFLYGPSYVPSSYKPGKWVNINPKYANHRIDQTLIANLSLICEFAGRKQYEFLVRIYDYEGIGKILNRILNKPVSALHYLLANVIMIDVDYDMYWKLSNSSVWYVLPELTPTGGMIQHTTEEIKLEGESNWDYHQEVQDATTWRADPLWT